MKKQLGIIFSIMLFLNGAVGCTAKIGTPQKPAVKPRYKSKLFSEKSKVKVISVIDGDTIEVAVDGKQEKVQLLGVNAPDQGEYLFEEATNKMKELIEGEEVQLVKDISERDKDGRLLRYVFADSTFVNAELVRLGYANCYFCFPDFRYSDFLFKMQRKAKEEGKGLWTKAEGGFIGSIKSKTYHYPGCVLAQKLKAADKMKLLSVEDAQARGYSACKYCRPPSVAIAGESVKPLRR